MEINIEKDLEESCLEILCFDFPWGSALGFEREEIGGLRDENLIVLGILLVKKSV